MNRSPVKSRAHLGLALALALSVALPAGTALAQQQQAQLTIRDFGQSRLIELETNKSMLVDLPADVAEVVVSSPGIAGAIMRTTRRAILQGVSGGTTNVLFLDAQGRPIAIVDLKIVKERSQSGVALESALARIIPGSAITVDSVTLADEQNRLVLSGTVLSQDDSARALSVAAQFAGGPDNVASIIEVSGPQQVMIKVTVAEVSRETVKQLGINLAGALSGTLTTNLISTQPLGGASNVVTASGLSVAGQIGNVAIEAMLRALERRGAMRTLAEPTLTAKSGQSAEFMAGGEFPVPTAIDKEGTVTYTFKEFGVKLNFTPTVRSNGMIEMAVETDVSEPSSEGSFNVGSITIPGTKDRRAMTTVELQPGMTLAIGGLMQDQVRQQVNQLPGLGNIPILGALFRSRDFVHSETELVILVTPYLVEPSQHIATPTDHSQPASDAEAIFLGRLESLYGVGNDQGMRGSFGGSVGFVLD